jgi:hypothetical protein
LTLSSAEDSAVQYVDLAHEALISCWPTLQKWITQHRANEQTRRYLESRAADWAAHNRVGGLLN